MKAEDYSQGEAFQVEKRTVFATECLPLCAEGQVSGAGDFLAASVGGWGVVAVRDKQGTMRVLRNACRHQNMQVVGTPSGTCETFRCRFHGWTYDLQGRFVSAPPPVAPKDAASADLHLAVLPSRLMSGLVFFSLDPAAPVPSLDLGPLAAFGGTLTTEIACNWKVCVEHLLADHAPSADFTWLWPLLAIRRAGSLTIVEQVVPHTFLRTRLFTHVFGCSADEHRQAAATIGHVCETLQADRAAGQVAIQGRLVDDFHRRLAAAYAGDRAMAG
ncbi:MAG: Rieske (2Fe-2S) protein [Alphaproteobacteria bacterium]|nr:Rieske (2Fe-2S) protein [Alphaproteobacteria bacterium]